MPTLRDVKMFKTSELIKRNKLVHQFFRSPNELGMFIKIISPQCKILKVNITRRNTLIDEKSLELVLTTLKDLKNNEKNS